MRRDAPCVPAQPIDTLTTRLNALLNTSGPGFILNLCPSTLYYTIAPLEFAAPNQEITTLGNPTDNTRATIVVNGSRAHNATGHTVAVSGQCPQCFGCKLHHLQINGTRNGRPPQPGSANIEMGGPTSGQVIEFVRSVDPRSWSCLHAGEGPYSNCTSITIQNNDIGPCGTDVYDQWADGISVACRDSTVRSNILDTPTDGGIVLFGSPGTLVENNTVMVKTHTLLGGINLVDFTPFGGNYTGVVVRNNLLKGGFATSPEKSGETRGTNQYNAMMKIGIAMGSRTWFGYRGYNNVSFGAHISGNNFTGGFGFAMVANSVRNFTVENNLLVGNTAFFGLQGPNCTKGAPVTPGAFIEVEPRVNSSTLQSGFTNTSNGERLVCIVPPNGSYWPFDSGVLSPEAGHGSGKGKSIGLGVGLSLGLLGALLLTMFLLRRLAASRRTSKSITY